MFVIVFASGMGVVIVSIAAKPDDAMSAMGGGHATRTDECLHSAWSGVRPWAGQVEARELTG